MAPEKRSWYTGEGRSASLFVAPRQDTWTDSWMKRSPDKGRDVHATSINRSKMGRLKMAIAARDDAAAVRTRQPVFCAFNQLYYQCLNLCLHSINKLSHVSRQQYQLSFCHNLYTFSTFVKATPKQNNKAPQNDTAIVCL